MRAIDSRRYKSTVSALVIITLTQVEVTPGNRARQHTQLIVEQLSIIRVLRQPTMGAKIAIVCQQ